MNAKMLIELSEVAHRDALETTDLEQARYLESVAADYERAASARFKTSCLDCGRDLAKDEAITCAACERQERAELAAMVAP